MKVLIVALSCLLCCGQLRAQGTEGTFRSGVDLVSLNVIVTDNHDKFISGLTQKDFSVFEDGIQQDVSFFAAANVPLDLAVLLDASSSMSDKMATVQEAAVGFASHLREGDRVTVVGIKDTARTLHELDGDVKGACDAIRRTGASGGTALRRRASLRRPDCAACRLARPRSRRRPRAAATAAGSGRSRRPRACR